MRRVSLLVLIAFGSAGGYAAAETASEVVVAAAAMSSCTCYYTYDEECPKGFVCTENWDPIGCIRMKPKGGAWAGKCNVKDEQKKVRPCDATCTEKKGTVCTGQDAVEIANTLDLWRQAMTRPAEQGGGLIDPGLTAQARAAALSAACIEYLGWRTLAVLELCRGHEITDHTDPDHDALEEHVLANLAGDTCRIESGNLCLQAIESGVTQGAAAVDPIVDRIPGVCPDGLPLASPGPGYENVSPLDAVKDRLRTTVGGLQAPTPTPTEESNGGRSPK